MAVELSTRALLGWDAWERVLGVGLGKWNGNSFIEVGLLGGKRKERKNKIKRKRKGEKIQK